jgi:hypothetical protein
MSHCRSEAVEVWHLLLPSISALNAPGAAALLLAHRHR